MKNGCVLIWTCFNLRVVERLVWIHMAAQKDVNFFTKTVAVTDNWLAYTEKQLNDVEKFCCKVTDSTILAVDAAFNLCIMWITDTSYRNLRLWNGDTRNNTVHLGPIMVHFIKKINYFPGLHQNFFQKIGNLKI